MLKHSKEDIEDLFMEKIAGCISPEDDLVLKKYINEDEEVRLRWLAIQQKYEDRGETFVKLLDDNKAWDKLKPTLIKGRSNHKFIAKYWIYAAAVLTLVCGALFHFHIKTPTVSELQVVKSVKEAEKGIALLLADGRSVSLAQNGKIQLGTTQLDIAEGKLDYQSKDKTVEWNTLSVPLKKDYKLTLSDGTEVWLNSASDLRFPFNFTGENREVYLSGEAYFKVAKNAKKPFIVHTGGTQIKVLGTSFNVNNYGVKVVTSLVEGSVLNIAGNSQVKLTPGYQSVYRDEKGFQKEFFNAETTLSWIDGVYILDNTSIKELSDIIYRWFDVKVVVDNPEIYQLTFTGAIEKTKPLNVFIENLRISSGVVANLQKGELHLK
ncbi:fec operon regulator FecR [compost metagenome]